MNEAEAAAAKETGAEFVLPQIIFDHVSFSYEDGDGEDCLHDVSFTVNKGETLGIIGATGSGKTTIVNLLMRYYDPDEGHIYVNGRDVRTYTSKELMPLFGAAFQNDVIFHDTKRFSFIYCKAYIMQTVFTVPILIAEGYMIENNLHPQDVSARY